MVRLTIVVHGRILLVATDVLVLLSADDGAARDGRGPCVELGPLRLVDVAPAKDLGLAGEARHREGATWLGLGLGLGLGWLGLGWLGLGLGLGLEGRVPPWMTPVIIITSSRERTVLMPD